MNCTDYRLRTTKLGKQHFGAESIRGRTLSLTVSAAADAMYLRGKTSQRRKDFEEIQNFNSSCFFI